VDEINAAPLPHLLGDGQGGLFLAVHVDQARFGALRVGLEVGEDRVQHLSLQRRRRGDRRRSGGAAGQHPRGHSIGLLLRRIARQVEAPRAQRGCAVALL